MTITETPLKDCFIIQPRVFQDERGYFFESHNAQSFNKAMGCDVNFVQDNQSFSSKGVLRGLHLQTGDYAQSKLVRVSRGKVLDVAVDLRKGSDTYGKYHSVILSDENHHQFFIPKGFAHGFLVLSDVAVFQYKCDNYYNKESEAGLHYADPELNIDWGLPESELIVSEKDQVLPFLKDDQDKLKNL